jgi:hypothetical protein
LPLSSLIRWKLSKLDFSFKESSRLKAVRVFQHLDTPLDPQRSTASLPDVSCPSCSAQSLQRLCRRLHQVFQLDPVPSIRCPSKQMNTLRHCIRLWPTDPRRKCRLGREEGILALQKGLLPGMIYQVHPQSHLILTAFQEYLLVSPPRCTAPCSGIAVLH